MSQLDRVRRVYDRDPGRYHRAMSSGLSARMLAGRREALGELMRGRVLDVGFGTGLSLAHYAAATRVVGVDASLASLRFARLANPDRRLELVVADAEHLPFTAATFDSVAFNLCLCTIADPAAAVREGIRVARPSAPIACLEHVRSHLWPIAWLQDLISPLLVLWQADHFNRRTAETVRRAGVKVERVDRWLWGVFNLIVGRAPQAGRP